MLLILSVTFLDAFENNSTKDVYYDKMQQKVLINTEKIVHEYIDNNEKLHYDFIIWVLGIMGTIIILAALLVAWFFDRFVSIKIRLEIQNALLQQYKNIEDLKDVISNYDVIKMFADDIIKANAIKYYKSRNLQNFKKEIDLMLNNAEKRNVIRTIVHIDSEISSQNEPYLEYSLKSIHSNAERKNILIYLIDAQMYETNFFKKLANLLYENNKEQFKVVSNYLEDKNNKFAEVFLKKYDLTDSTTPLLDEVTLLMKRVEKLEKA